MRGRFIVLEGPDGVGKSTQVALLQGWLEGIGRPHLVVREPGGTALGEAIRSVALSDPDLSVPPASELLLMLAARAALVTDVLEPALADGTTVIADRFELSTMAYQGYGRGLGVERVRPALGVATGGLRPDLYVLLDLPPDEALRRREGGAEGPDRIEREGDAFRRAVRDGYLALAESEPGVVLLDAQGSPEEVHVRIRDLLGTRFPQDFGSQRDTE